jgi:hypothetical protein
VIPSGSLPHQETALELLAAEAELEPDELRELLRELIEDAWRAEQQRILGEAVAESAGEPR